MFDEKPSSKTYLRRLRLKTKKRYERFDVSREGFSEGSTRKDKMLLSNKPGLGLERERLGEGGGKRERERY